MSHDSSLGRPVDLDQALRSVQKIPRESPLPTEQADELTVQEELGLSPYKKAAYHHRKYTRHLEREHRELVAELDRIRPIEVAHSRLVQANKSHRFVAALTTVGMVVGGGMISTFQWHPEPVFFSIGWTLLLFGGAVQLCKSVLDI